MNDIVLNTQSDTVQVCDGKVVKFTRTYIQEDHNEVIIVEWRTVDRSGERLVLHYTDGQSWYTQIGTVSFITSRFIEGMRDQLLRLFALTETTVEDIQAVCTERSVEIIFTKERAKSKT